MMSSTRGPPRASSRSWALAAYCRLVRGQEPCGGAYLALTLATLGGMHPRLCTDACALCVNSPWVDEEAMVEPPMPHHACALCVNSPWVDEEALVEPPMPHRGGGSDYMPTDRDRSRARL